MRDNLPNMLRAAAKEWRKEYKVVATGATRYDAALDEAADAIEELSQPRWIPVTERLPEKTNHYLVHIECKCDGELMSKWTQIAWFCKKFYWEHSHGTEFFEETVTHWTPLPQPPKEET